MAEHKVVIVSELAPRLKKFSSAAARKFLREYVAFENRLDVIGGSDSIKAVPRT